MSAEKCTCSSHCLQMEGCSCGYDAERARLYTEKKKVINHLRDIGHLVIKKFNSPKGQLRVDSITITRQELEELK